MRQRGRGIIHHDICHKRHRHLPLHADRCAGSSNQKPGVSCPAFLLDDSQLAQAGGERYL